MQSFAQKRLDVGEAPTGWSFFSGDSVLEVLKLILAGSALPEVLTVIARLVESRGQGILCTIWLPDAQGEHLYCAAAPSLPDLVARAEPTLIGPNGASCGTAVYRREPVYVADILQEPIWEGYRDRVSRYGVRAVWSRPLFTREGKVLGTFAILYREVREPDAVDLELIENASHIAGIAIERHMHQEALHHERDRLRLLLEVTSSMTSKLDLPRLIEALSTNLLRVTRCDFCALLLPDAESGELRLTTLYNPEPQGAVSDGATVPLRGSICGKAFRTGQTQHYHNLEEFRDDPDSFGNSVGERFFEQVRAEGLVSGCDLPLIGRRGAVGVLAALKRSERAFEKDDVLFLEQVGRQVAIAVENALEYQKVIADRDKETKQRLYLEEEIRSEVGAIVGDSPALKATLSLASLVAPTDSSVLIQGDTGTGKELIARAIHDRSGRRGRPFVKLNCAAIPLGLLESELFGHERGAFTGAITQKMGRFEVAHKGTLFLDEVGDIPLELQAKLLRVLQEQEFERLGGTRTYKVDVRVIAATHRDLIGMVRQSTFREDLYYRLRVFPISVPALRERKEDIPKLVWYFTDLYARRMNKQISEIPSATMEALMRYRWPGNIRELQNLIERAVILSPRSVLAVPISELDGVHGSVEANISTMERESMTGLQEVERDHIVRALEASNWVVGGANGAAQRLGMKRTSLLYRMQKLGIGRGARSAKNGAVRHDDLR